MLILFGIAFILIENRNRGARPAKTDIAQFTYRDAIIIGLFQLIAAVFPGTSRSGATIVGALLIGISRTAAAEFTFFLAIPAMFGGVRVRPASVLLLFLCVRLLRPYAKLRVPEKPTPNLRDALCRYKATIR